MTVCKDETSDCVNNIRDIKCSMHWISRSQCQNKNYLKCCVRGDIRTNWFDGGGKTAVLFSFKIQKFEVLQSFLPEKLEKKKKIQVLFCRLFRRHEVHYLSGFLLPAMLQLMANFALLGFHNCDWLFKYWSCLSDWWDDREVIAETSCQVRLSFFAILPQEYCINFASLVVKCCQIDSIAQISD